MTVYLVGVFVIAALIISNKTNLYNHLKRTKGYEPKNFLMTLAGTIIIVSSFSWVVLIPVVVALGGLNARK